MSLPWYMNEYGVMLKPFLSHPPEITVIPQRPPRIEVQVPWYGGVLHPDPKRETVRAFLSNWDRYEKEENQRGPEEAFAGVMIQLALNGNRPMTAHELGVCCGITKQQVYAAVAWGAERRIIKRAGNGKRYFQLTLSKKVAPP